jgi:hypothetical protein
MRTGPPPAGFVPCYDPVSLWDTSGIEGG